MRTPTTSATVPIAENATRSRNSTNALNVSSTGCGFGSESVIGRYFHHGVFTQ